MLSKYELKLPDTVYGGEDALDQIGHILTDNGVKKAAVFADQGVEHAGLLDIPLEKIRGAGVEYCVLDDLPPEPSYAEAQKLVDQCKAAEADFIIAVGGGSVMDTAKLASILITENYGVKELLDDPARAKKCLRTLMIPTTAGTGSEATPNAIVAVPEKQLKIGIVNRDMIADYVILDVTMIKGLPRKIAAATGVDALAHAIECFTSNKANPFSDLYALEALDLILNNIQQACDAPNDVAAKRSVQIASFYAGIAIAASGCTAVHALSYPLGGRYHIAHGVSNAILLAPVMRFNEPACREKFAEAYDRCIRGGIINAAEKSAALIARLEEIVRHLDIPSSLSEFGVRREDLPELVSAGMEATRLLVNNRREVTPADAAEIYRQIL